MTIKNLFRNLQNQIPGRPRFLRSKDLIKAFSQENVIAGQAPNGVWVFIATLDKSHKDITIIFSLGDILPNESEGVPFKIDDIEFDNPSTAKEGTWQEDARFVTVLEAPQNYEVVVQPTCGFKSITQATEPIALKTINATVYTFTLDDKEKMDALDNKRPREVQCHLFTTSPILMYLQQKIPRVFRTGLQPYAIEWQLKLIECNDNNNV